MDTSRSVFIRVESSLSDEEREEAYAQSKEQIKTQKFSEIFGKEFFTVYLKKEAFFTVILTLVSLFYTVTFTVLHWHFPPTDTWYYNPDYKVQFWISAIWFPLTVVISLFTGTICIAIVMYGEWTSKLILAPHLVFVPLSFILNFAPWLLSSFGIPNFSWVDNVGTACSLGCMIWCGVAIGRVINNKFLWVYLFILILDLALFAVIYQFVLPIFIKDYLLTRLVVHPIIMGFLIAVARRIALVVPKAQPYTSYAVCLSSFLINSMLGRILLTREADLKSLLLGAFLTSIEGFIFNVTSPFLQDYIGKFIRCGRRNFTKEMGDIVLCTSFAADNMGEFAAILMAPFAVYMCQYTSLTQCNGVGASTLVGGMIIQLILQALVEYGSLFAMVKFYGLDIVPIWGKISTKNFIWVSTMAVIGAIDATYALTNANFDLFFGCST